VCLSPTSPFTTQLLPKLSQSGGEPVLVEWKASREISYVLPSNVHLSPGSVPQGRLHEKQRVAFEKLRAKHAGTTATRGPKLTDTPPQGGGGAGAASAEGAQRDKALPAIPGERCGCCGATETCQWRMGPDGPKTLCNACGKRKRKQMDTPPSAAGHPGAARKSSGREMPAGRKRARTEPGPGDVAGAAGGGGADGPLAGRDPHRVLLRLNHQLTNLSCTASTAADIGGLIASINEARQAFFKSPARISDECHQLARRLVVAELNLLRLHGCVQRRLAGQLPCEEENDEWQRLAEASAAPFPRPAVGPSDSELDRDTADMHRMAKKEGQPFEIAQQLLPSPASGHEGHATRAPAAAAPPSKQAGPSLVRPQALYPTPGASLTPGAAEPAAPPLTEKEKSQLLHTVLDVLSAQPDSFKLDSFLQAVYNRLIDVKEEWNRRLGNPVEKSLKTFLEGLHGVQRLWAVDEALGIRSIRITDEGRKYLQQCRGDDAEPQQPGAARGAVGAPEPGPGGGGSGARPSSEAGGSRLRRDVVSAAAVASAPSDQLDELTECAVKVLRGKGRLSFQEFEDRMAKLRNTPQGKGRLRDSFCTRTTASRWYLFGNLVDKRQKGGRVIWLHEPAQASGPPESFLYKRLHAAGAAGIVANDALRCLREAFPHLVEMAASGTTVKNVTAFNRDFLKSFKNSQAEVVWIEGARLALTAAARARSSELGASRPLRPAKEPRATGGAGVRKVQGPKLTGGDRMEVTASDYKAMSTAMKAEHDLWCRHRDTVRTEAHAAEVAAAQQAAGPFRRGGGAPRGGTCHMCEQPASGCPPCGSCHLIFCAQCLRECFSTPSLSAEALRASCPVCRSICICDDCSSQPHWRNLARFSNATLAERKEHAKYVLAVTKVQQEEVQRQQRAALAAAGVAIPKRMNPRADGGGRVNCDGCNTSIADMCWCCDVAGACEQVDLCLKCAETLRAGAMPLLLRTRFDPASVQPVPPGGQLLCPCYHDRQKAAGPSKQRQQEDQEQPPPLLTLHTIMDAPALVDGVLAALPGPVASLTGDVQGDRVHNSFQEDDRRVSRPEPCPWCCWLASLTKPDADGVRDLRTNPNLRRAAWRGEADDWLWTPHADDVDRVKLGEARYKDAVAHFQWHFRRRQFPVVRGLTPQLAWSPGQLKHLLAQQEAEDQRVTQVLWCRDGATGPCSAEDFAAAFGDLMRVPFARGEDERHGKLFARLGDMLKLKDWPAEKSFGDAVPRHCHDFITMLPFQEYTNMRDGPLNLATRLPQACFPPDLGPKSYVAHGIQQERGGPTGGDSVTRLHEDMSDAVNVLLHSQDCNTQLVKHLPEHQQEPLAPPPRQDDDVYERSSLGPGALKQALQLAKMHQAAAGDVMRCEPDLDARVVPAVVQQPVLEPSTAGALWHTFRRQDTQALGSWLMARLGTWKAAPDEAQKREALSCGVVCAASEVDHPIHSQAFYLGAADLHALKFQTSMPDASGVPTAPGLEPWGFYQYDHECVFIPAGCPHQVRNTRSCIKVALDFVSPEAVRECNELAGEYARIGMEDKLQGRAMLIHGAVAALGDLLEQPAGAAQGA
jgi:lysine-specific demethylase 3